MIAGQRVLAVIPARGGSKGIPRKNLRLVAGRPLITWSIACACASRYLDRIIVSTDDNDIASVAVAHGAEVPFRRPTELAADTTPGSAPIVHAVQQLGSGYDIVVTLQPTSPLRSAALVDAVVERLVTAQAGSCVSLTPVKHDPSWIFRLTPDGELLAAFDGPEATRRQDGDALYQLDGAVYATRTDRLLVTGTVRAPPCVGVISEEPSVDVDDLLDLLAADAWLRTHGPT